MFVGVFQITGTGKYFQSTVYPHGKMLEILAKLVDVERERTSIDPVTGRENLLENEPGSTPVDREYNGIPFYGIKYTWEGMAMEVGFFPFGTHTYGYTIVGEPDESDVAIMLSNIHGLE